MFIGKVFPGAGLILEKDKKVLMALILRLNHIRWELPAGRAKAGEAMTDTAVREGLEETYLLIQPIRPVGVCWHYSHKRRAGWYGLFFSATTSDSENKIPAQKRLENFNFDALRRKEQQGAIEEMRKEAKREDILAVGFVDWRIIDERRIHPLHYHLLEEYDDKTQNDLIFVAGDGEQDYVDYSVDVPIYL